MKSRSLSTVVALPLAVLLCAAGPARAGKVTVKVGGRPGAAAAVAGWSGALDTAATDALAGKTLVPGKTRAEWIGINFAKHHIIPQTDWQVVAGLSVHAEAGNEALRTRLVAAIRKVAAGGKAAAGGPPAAWNLAPVVWSPVNVFEGPTGFYRSDDPGEGGEKAKPKSFDATRWDKLEAVKAAVDNLGAIKGADFESSTDKLNKQQKGGKTGFEKLVEAVEALEALDADTVHPFTGTDWVNGAAKVINVADLVVYHDNQVQVATSAAKKNGYKLK